MHAPKVITLTPSSVNVTWKLPIQANGRIDRYIIKFPEPRYEIYNTSVTSLVVEDLVPYTLYYITLTVCSGECLLLNRVTNTV